jgi:hypothetical protein
MKKRNSKSIIRWRVVESTGLKEKFESYLSDYLEKYDDASAERIARAFIADNPELVQEYAQAFAADLVRQREFWPKDVWATMPRGRSR